VSRRSFFQIIIIRNLLLLALVILFSLSILHYIFLRTALDATRLHLARHAELIESNLFKSETSPKALDLIYDSLFTIEDKRLYQIFFYSSDRLIWSSLHYQNSDKILLEESGRDLQAHEELIQLEQKLESHAIRRDRTQQKVFAFGRKIFVDGNFFYLTILYPYERISAEVTHSLLFAFGLLVFIFLVIGIIYFFNYRSFFRAFNQLKHKTREIASSRIAHFYPDSDFREIQDLGKAINLISRRSQEQMKKIDHQKNEYKILLANLQEGVIALDNAEKILLINKAACYILNIEDQRYKGQSITEVSRNSAFIKFIKNAELSAQHFYEEDFALVSVSLKENEASLSEKKFIRAQATKIEIPEEKKGGLLIVLHDFTKIQKLENIRKEFVANVSHELKTPITTILGFVETMLNGNVNDSGNTQNFLEIIRKNSIRLDKIIDDLLLLAKLEQEGDTTKIVKEQAAVHEILEAAVNNCSDKLKANDFTVTIECSSELTALVNPNLIEHTVVNLIDNAIKYSHPGKEINIYATRENQNISIRVRDWGEALPEEKLQRLFERFYRLDKARSRKMGGTGLGLAIVKHIILAHGGSVDVKSVAGEGTTFTLTIPA